MSGALEILQVIKSWDLMDFKAVVLDTSVWIDLKGHYGKLEKFDYACRNLGIDVLVPSTVFRELVGCHINEMHRATNLSTLSYVKHKVIPDYVFIQDETYIGLGKLTSEDDAAKYISYRANGNVRKKRDFVIAKTAQDANARLIWANDIDRQKLERHGIKPEIFTSIDAILNESGKFLSKLTVR